MPLVMYVITVLCSFLALLVLSPLIEIRMIKRGDFNVLYVYNMQWFLEFLIFSFFSLANIDSVTLQRVSWKQTRADNLCLLVVWGIIGVYVCL